MQPTSSTRKPRASSQARIAAILDAARGLLADEGIGGLTIYSVAERAEMPPSSVYHFFPSVPALLQGLTGEVHAAFRAFGHAIDGQAADAFVGEQAAGGVEDR
uniref:TetR/AcrR family transcriptional regulator n=4 Tax=Pseudomonas aeruginosa TaxID=287 RepID=UPI000651E8A8